MLFLNSAVLVTPVQIVIGVRGCRYKLKQLGAGFIGDQLCDALCVARAGEIDDDRFFATCGISLSSCRIFIGCCCSAL